MLNIHWPTLYSRDRMRNGKFHYGYDWNQIIQQLKNDEASSWVEHCLQPQEHLKLLRTILNCIMRKLLH